MTSTVPAPRATISEVQRFSIHDGPGIRTVVFFKGCTLACAWCQNPEAIGRLPELARYPGRCIARCTACRDACPEQAVVELPGPAIDRALCTNCGACADVCPSGALRMIGREVAADELLGEILRDRAFYRTSGGGVTLSGGEPVVHASFLAQLLPKAREQGLHMAIETAGNYPFARLAPLLPLLDLVLYDIKLVDPARHRKATGHDNALIRENLTRLAQQECALEVRMPVIPGHNTDTENLEATAGLLRELQIYSITLLPYNHLWESKLVGLATDRKALGIALPEPDFYAEIQRRFAACGISVRT